MRKSEVALNQLLVLSIENPDLSKIADGIYEGSYEAFPVKVVVTVEVADHRIVTVELKEHRNGQGKDAESLLPHIVATQSVELDAVAGATYSSKVILKAVEQALLLGR
ncbi:MAG: FMN-binding protein [Spirochaetae bacterium HGW-Spirochaetae-2]|nr:MAG: FMN-binding protein [Spirochaetae bacterium HGW-Spirochaetae-2]